MVTTTKSILQSLNEEQINAVQHLNGPMLIIAGPGSGKTRVITHRIAHLILSGTIKNSNVLAVTFTNKAANELKTRISNMALPSMNSVTASTFHSFCARILRTHGKYVGLDNNYTIYDSDDQLSAIKESMILAEIDPKQANARAIQNIISKSKSSLKDSRSLLVEAESYFEELAANVFSKYEELLQRNNAADFDDLISKSVDLLSNNPRIQDFYNQNFQQVMIDEFQDTNASQYLLAKLLVEQHNNISVVGDPNQSIYSWRNADITNILNFQDDFPGTKTITINQNYRSTKQIVSVAKNIISKNSLSIENELFTDNEQGSPVIIHETYDELDEASFVITEIKRITSNNFNLNDVAVMYRVNAQSRALEEACLKSSVKYRIVGGIQFYQRKEIKDLLSYLTIIHNSSDDISMIRSISNPGKGIGKKTIEDLKSYSESLGQSLYETLKNISETSDNEPALNSRSTKLLTDFYQKLVMFTDESQHLPLIELIDLVLSQSGLQDSILSSSDKSQERWENILEFRETAREFNTQDTHEGLSALLDRLSLINVIDKYDESDDCLTLITLHQAKGLEFPVVFMVGLEEGLLPHSRSFDSHDQIEEERRLCYVGVTRAQKVLYLTNAFRRGLMGRYGPTVKSRFLENLDGLIDYAAIETTKSKVKPIKRNITALGKTTSTHSPKPDPKIGQHINHNTFGEGIITDIEPINNDFEIVIQFNSQIGVKKLLHSFAPIEILPT
jgi:DNA helicase-2/ATP-dependent DNA helicase PcrA